MDGEYGYRVWLPIIVTGAVWIGLVFAIAALVSNMWADLIGLFYLMASPFIYGGLQSLMRERPPDDEGQRGGIPVP